VKEQFVEALPKEVRVWVKERKLRTTQEAGRLAEDYHQITMVRSDFVRKNKLNGEKSVVVQCAHGDTVEYPVARIIIRVWRQLCQTSCHTYVVTD